MKKVRGDKRYKLAVIKSVSHRDAMHSTGNMVINSSDFVQ